MVIRLLVLVIASVLLTQQTYAAGVGDIARNISSNIKSILAAFEWVCILLSAILGIGALLKATEHYRNPHSVKMSLILMMLVVSACFGSFSYFLEIQTGTLFGSNANKGARIPRL